MAERFEISELTQLAHLMGYELTHDVTRDDCCYELQPTDAAEFEEAGLSVPPVSGQQLDEWGLYSKLAFAVERFVAELMSKVRQKLDQPNTHVAGQRLRNLATFLKVPEEYVGPAMGWRSAFEIADNLMGLARRLHAAELAAKGRQSREPKEKTRLD